MTSTHDDEMPYLIAAHLRHLRRRNLSPATLRARRNILRALDAYLTRAGVALADATLADLELWQDSLTISATSVRSYVANVSAFYRWAVRFEYLDRDPTARLVKPKARQTVPRPVPEADLATALRLAHGRVRPILVLAAFVGLRVSEIAAMRREDVIRDPAGVFLLVHGKGDKDRLVSLVGDVLDELTPWLPGGRGPVFPGLTGKKITELVSRHFRVLGMPHVAHQLRHRFGTRLYGVTRDLRLVQQVMGHASSTMTAGYVLVGGTDSAAGMALVAQDLPPALGTVLLDGPGHGAVT